MADSDLDDALPARSRIRLRFSLLALLLLTTLVCVVLTIARVDNQRQLAKRDLFARRLETLESEIAGKLDEFLILARKSGNSREGSTDRPIIEMKPGVNDAAKLEYQARELQQLQQIANDMSVKLESMDIESTTWFQRIQSSIGAR